MLNINNQNYNFPAFKASYSKISGLRSMQHIKGVEREIIEAYKNELTHDVWGNPEKLKEWALEKVDYIAYGDYPSRLLDPDLLYDGRINGVKNWYELVKENNLTKNNPFMQLKIMKFVTENLLPDNKALAPIINKKVFDDSVHQVNKYGYSFKKTYNRLMKVFDSGLDVKVDEVYENGVRGKWFCINVPNWAESERSPGLFNKIKEYISILSQGSNWCTKTPRTVGRGFSGCKFHIFVDEKGVPQLCLTSREGNDLSFKYIKGNNQYKPIPDDYKKVLKSYFERNGLDDAKLENEIESQSVMNLCV